MQLLIANPKRKRRSTKKRRTRRARNSLGHFTKRSAPRRRKRATRRPQTTTKRRRRTTMAKRRKPTRRRRRRGLTTRRGFIGLDLLMPTAAVVGGFAVSDFVARQIPIPGVQPATGRLISKGLLALLGGWGLKKVAGKPTAISFASGALASAVFDFIAQRRDDAAGVSGWESYIGADGLGDYGYSMYDGADEFAGLGEMDYDDLAALGCGDQLGDLAGYVDVEARQPAFV